MRARDWRETLEDPMTQMQKVTSTSPSSVGPSISLRMRPNAPAMKTKTLEANIRAITPAILPSDALILSPRRPQIGENYLRFHQPMMVTSEPGHDFALFDSAYSDFAFPDVQVTFMPIKAGKSHLVEFHIQLFKTQSTSSGSSPTQRAIRRTLLTIKQALSRSWSRRYRATSPTARRSCSSMSQLKTRGGCSST